MKQHDIEFPWELEIENAKIYVQAVLVSVGADLPVTVNVQTPRWVHTFVFEEKDTA